MVKSFRKKITFLQHLKERCKKVLILLSVDYQFPRRFCSFQWLRWCIFLEISFFQKLRKKFTKKQLMNHKKHFSKCISRHNYCRFWSFRSAERKTACWIILHFNHLYGIYQKIFDEIFFTFSWALLSKLVAVKLAGISNRATMPKSLSKVFF